MNDPISINDVIEFFRQELPNPHAWAFIPSRMLEIADFLEAQAEEIAKLKQERDDAYEKAAQECFNVGETILALSCAGEMALEATSDCAKSIRALKQNPDQSA